MVPSDAGVVRASVIALAVGLTLYGSLIVSPAGRAIVSPKVRRATSVATRIQAAETVLGAAGLTLGARSEVETPDVALLRTELDHLYGKLDATRSELQRLKQLARSAKPAAPGPGPEPGPNVESHLRLRLHRAKRVLLTVGGTNAAHVLPTGAVPPLSVERKASASPIAFIKTHKVHSPTLRPLCQRHTTASRRVVGDRLFGHLDIAR